MKAVLSTIALAMLPAISLAASISVSEDAAFSGNRGMRVLFDEQRPAYVQDNAPEAETRYHARFYFRLDGIVMGRNDDFDLFAGLDGADTEWFRLQVARVGTQYEVRWFAADNMKSVTKGTSGVSLTDGWHWVEVDWKAGAGDGFLNVTVDGSTPNNLTNLINDQGAIDKVRLGLLEGDIDETTGYVDFDDFVSRADSAIGVAPTASGISDVSVIVNAAPTVIDARARFFDQDDPITPLIISVTGNTNPGLVTPTVDGGTGQVTLTYTGDTTGEATITVRATDSAALFTDTTFLVTVEPDPSAEHAADQNNDMKFSLGELLRVIQLYNADAYSCAATSTEDGFMPGDTGTQTCDPHSGDYVQNWEFSLGELLRMVQIFNRGGYTPCGGTPPGEDGYCLAP